jgi:hypothetical protein
MTFEMERKPLSGPLSLTASDWWSVLKGVRATAERVNLGLIAGGVAFFGLMAAIPGIAAIVALVGLFGDPTWIEDQIQALGGLAPDAVVSIIHAQATRLLATHSDTLVAGTIFNLFIALWSALQGTRWTLMALTAVNDHAEQRSVLRRFLSAGMFTLSGIGLSVLAVSTMGAMPLILSFLHVETGMEARPLAKSCRYMRQPPARALTKNRLLPSRLNAGCRSTRAWGDTTCTAPPSALTTPTCKLPATSIVRAMRRESGLQAGSKW